MPILEKLSSIISELENLKKDSLKGEYYTIFNRITYVIDALENCKKELDN